MYVCIITKLFFTMTYHHDISYVMRYVMVVCHHDICPTMTYTICHGGHFLWNTQWHITMTYKNHHDISPWCMSWRYPMTYVTMMYLMTFVSIRHLHDISPMFRIWGFTAGAGYVMVSICHGIRHGEYVIGYVMPVYVMDVCHDEVSWDM